MSMSRALLWWYFREAWYVSLPMLLLAAGYVTLYSGRLSEARYVPAIFVFVHSVFIAWSMGRFASPAAAFLYTRGFTRDRLWVHRIVSHLLAVLAVWGPASLIVWLGVRSAVQGHLVGNADYPIFKSVDFVAPLWWLAGYLLLLGIVQYGPVRRAQPNVDRDAGHAITTGIALAALVLLGGAFNLGWFAVLVWCAFVFTSCLLLYGSWRLHREVEVRP